MSLLAARPGLPGPGRPPAANSQLPCTAASVQLQPPSCMRPSQCLEHGVDGGEGEHTQARWLQVAGAALFEPASMRQHACYPCPASSVRMNSSSVNARQRAASRCAFWRRSTSISRSCFLWCVDRRQFVGTATA